MFALTNNNHFKLFTVHTYTTFNDRVVVWVFVCFVNRANGAEWRHSNQFNSQLRYYYFMGICFSFSFEFFLRIIVYLHQLTNIRKITIQSGSLAVSTTFSILEYYIKTDYWIQTTNERETWMIPSKYSHIRSM